MADDFRAKVTAELDTAEAESKLNAFLNEKRKLKIDVEVNQDSAKKMASSIEKGIKDTKIDTSGISKQLAGSFNITDKNVISKLQSQMDKMISSLGKTWNGKDFDFGKASGFYSGMDNMINTVTKNAKIMEGATGSYDAFFNYFKDKKIYVSDELKKAMGEDTYKELLQNNIGKIVRDASKGISIDSLWGEMSSLFPEHFSDNITNQVDQIVHAFDVLHQARADVGQVTTAQNMTAEQLTGISDSAAEQVVAIAAKLKESLQSTASAKGIVKITQTADSITLKGLKTGKTVIKVQGAGGYCKAVSLNVSVLKDATKNSKIVNSTAKSKKYTLTTEEKNRVLNMSTGQNANTVKANTKKEAELKKWYKALPAYIGGDAEIEKIKDPLVKHLAKKGKKASNANIIKAASILGYRDAKNVSKWDTKKKNAMVKKLQTFGFSKGGVIRNLIPATMGTLLGDAIMKNGDTGFIGAKPGETVLTQDFTKLLKPTTVTMQEFTEVMQKAGTPSVKETPVRQEVTMNNDYQFVINGVDVNDMSELKKVIRGELDKHDKELAKEFKKFR